MTNFRHDNTRISSGLTSITTSSMGYVGCCFRSSNLARSPESPFIRGPDYADVSAMNSGLELTRACLSPGQENLLDAKQRSSQEMKLKKL